MQSHAVPSNCYYFLSGVGFIRLVLAFNMAQWRAELRTAAM
jgi:hypothetical protein